MMVNIISFTIPRKKYGGELRMDIRPGERPVTVGWLFTCSQATVNRRRIVKQKVWLEKIRQIMYTSSSPPNMDGMPADLCGGHRSSSENPSGS